MDEPCERMFLFMRRNISRNKKDLSERVRVSGGLRQRHVSPMNGIKSSAKNADIHLRISMRFSPNALANRPLLPDT
jgi:hypothetical protein